MKSSNHSNITRLIALMATLWLCSSCIDTFEADLASTENTYIVVSGSICGNSNCEFILSRSLSLSPSYGDIRDRHINDATVRVCSSDGMRQEAVFNGEGSYLVQLDILNIDTEYWLEITWDGMTFASEATKPIVTSTIKEVSYVQPRPDQYVDFLITPEPHKTEEQQYFMWTFIEDWEIHTPYISNWDFDLTNDLVINAKQKTNRGWKSSKHNISIVGSNVDYTNGEIRNKKLYDRDCQSDFFNYLYRTTIKQRAITQKEYEYTQLAQRQSDDMGGLFTPQPAELPTNIHCLDGNAKAIGYIGVASSEVSKMLYVRGTDVGYKLTRIPNSPTESELTNSSNRQIYQREFRIQEYNTQTQKITWIERWAVDCTVWGASLTAEPEGWPTDRNEIAPVPEVE